MNTKLAKDEDVESSEFSPICQSAALRKTVETEIANGHPLLRLLKLQQTAEVRIGRDGITIMLGDTVIYGDRMTVSCKLKPY